MGGSVQLRTLAVKPGVEHDIKHSIATVQLVSLVKNIASFLLLVWGNRNGAPCSWC